MNAGTAREKSALPLPSKDHLATYDRRTELTQDEVASIEKLLTKNGKYPDMVWPEGIQIRWSPTNLPELERLAKPLLDVITATDTNEFPLALEIAKRRAIRVIFKEMYFRRNSLWAWTQEDWSETICRNNKLFFERHQVAPNCRLNIMALAYFFGDFSDFRRFGTYEIYNLACRLFGQEAIEISTTRIFDKLQRWGYKSTNNFKMARTTICEALIAVRSPRLEDITLEILAKLRKRPSNAHKSQKKYIHTYALAISKALVDLDILTEALTEDLHFDKPRPDIALINVSPEWASWCKRWRATSTLQPRTRTTTYYGMLFAGRWLHSEHPDIQSPAQLNRELVAEYVAAVDRARVGQWASDVNPNKNSKGKPLRPHTKAGYLRAVRTLLSDCQEWEWIPRQFNPHQVLRTPSSIYRLIGRNPRVIEDDVWAKLLCAGLCLTEEDLPRPNMADKHCGRRYYYPLEMMRALVIVWLFGGMRGDEIRRLRLGCIRWQQDYSQSKQSPENTLCLLQVPVGKTSPEFVKPVDRVVGEAIEAWERVRTDTPRIQDDKTSERVSLLFAHRTRAIGRQFINNVMIPMLCRKAGIPKRDARGDITGHRARSTIATQLSSFMTLLELMEWLGHAKPETTLYYVQTSVSKIATALKNSNFLERNVRTAGIINGDLGTAAGKLVGEDESECTPSVGSILAKLAETKTELLGLCKTSSPTRQQVKVINESIKKIDELSLELTKDTALIPC